MKSRKFLSGILALAIAAFSTTGFVTVVAADELTASITEYSVGSKNIMIKLDSSVEAAVLESEITLTCDGVNVPVVASAVTTPGSDTGVTYTDAVTRAGYVYTLTPESGAMEMENVYELSIGDNFAKKFKLHEILKADFSSEADLDKFTTYQNGTAHTNVLTIDNGRMKVDNNGNNHVGKIALVPTNYQTFTNYTDCTIEFDAEFYSVSSGYSSIFGSGVKDNYVDKGTWAGFFAWSNGYMQLRDGTNRPFTGFFGGTSAPQIMNGSYKVVPRTGVAEMYYNGYRIADYAHESFTTNNVFAFNLLNSGAVIYLDNIAVTKVEEVVDIEFNGIVTEYSVGSKNITVKLDSSVDVSVLEPEITLTCDGVDVPVTAVAVTTPGSDTGVTYTDAVARSGYVYTLTPEAGVMETDKVYNLIIGDNFDKKFKVQEILKADFSSEADLDKFTTYQNGTAHTNVLSIDNGRMKVDNNGNNHVGKIALVPANYQTFADYTNCTIEFDAEFYSVSSGYTSLFGPGVIDNYVNKGSWAGFFGWQNGIMQLRDGTNRPFTGFFGGTSNPQIMNGTYKVVPRTGVAEMYYNDYRVADYAHESFTTNNAFAFNLQNTGAVIYLDNVAITRYVEYMPISIEEKDYDTLPEIMVDLGCKADMSLFDESYVTVWNGDTKVEGLNVESVDDDTLKITFTTPLEYKTEYTVTLNSKLPALGMAQTEWGEASFKTIPPTFDLLYFENDNGTLKAELKNYRETNGAKCIATIVMYDANNVMLTARVGGIKNVALGDTTKIELDIVPEAVKAKCYVWDNFTDMTTLFEETIELTDVE